MVFLPKHQNSCMIYRPKWHRKQTKKKIVKYPCPTSIKKREILIIDTQMALKKMTIPVQHWRRLYGDNIPQRPLNCPWTALGTTPTFLLSPSAQNCSRCYEQPNDIVEEKENTSEQEELQVCLDWLHCGQDGKSMRKYIMLWSHTNSIIN